MLYNLPPNPDTHAVRGVTARLMVMMKKTTWKTTAVALISGLALGQPFARAQTIYSVADCTDLEALPSISRTDAVVDFTASPVCTLTSISKPEIEKWGMP